jgi:hypothetical protein
MASALHQDDFDRVADPEIARILRAIHETQKALDGKFDGLLLGFPQGDVDGHRRYHESVIEWQELRNKLVREALIKAAQAAGLAAIGWVGVALWQAFKMSVTR